MSIHLKLEEILARFGLDWNIGAIGAISIERLLIDQHDQALVRDPIADHIFVHAGNQWSCRLT